MSSSDESSDYQHGVELHPASSDYYVYQEQQVDLQMSAQPAQLPPQPQYQPAQQPPQPQNQTAQQPPQLQYQLAQQPPQLQYQLTQQPPQLQYQPQPLQQPWQFQYSQNQLQYQQAQNAQSPSQNQPAIGYPPLPSPQNQIDGPQGWSTGIFGCLKNPENAFITAFLPCVTFGQIAEVIDNGHSSCATSAAFYFVVLYCIGLPCIMSYSYRTKLRSKYNLVESPASDCLTHLLCEPCALCQEYNELQHRGLDPSIGWLGNLALQQQNYAMTPPRNDPMMH